MPIQRRHRVGLAVRASVLALVAVLTMPEDLLAQDTAGIRTYTGRRKIDLWPIEKVDAASRPLGEPITLGDWTYRAVKSPAPRDGVPWELIVTPAGTDADQWRKGQERSLLPGLVPTPGLAAQPRGGKQQTPVVDGVPVIELPDILWKQWMEPDMQDVVGIHYHTLVTDDQARILYTLHKVPPDNPDGTSGTPEPGAPPVGTRIEATLLAPVTYMLDQTILAREDPLDKERVKRRAEHELGHADISQQVLLAVLRGPQDWDPSRCVGRRSRIEYYWKREQIGRTWQGLRDGRGRVAALRTSIVLVPPTRWSMLLPIPPERVTTRHIERFNESVVMIGGTFAATDKLAQEQFHAQHGEYE